MGPEPTPGDKLGNIGTKVRKAEEETPEDTKAIGSKPSNSFRTISENMDLSDMKDS